MENLFDWVEDIKEAIILKPGITYYIECGNSFNEFIIRKAFDKIFGKDWVDFCYVGKLNTYINIFDNDNISCSMRNGNKITISIHYDNLFIYTGWDDGSYFKDNNLLGKFISMEDFINCCRIEK